LHPTADVVNLPTGIDDGWVTLSHHIMMMMMMMLSLRLCRFHCEKNAPIILELEEEEEEVFQ
jgi:hypothetical protein